MKKRLILALFLPLVCASQALATTAPENQPTEKKKMCVPSACARLLPLIRSTCVRPVGLRSVASTRSLFYYLN